MKKITIYFIAIVFAMSFIACSTEKEFTTVQIGNQIWMTENLNIDAGEGSYPYEKEGVILEKYGYIYNWEVAKNVCPDGWILPSKTDYLNLLDNYGGETEEAALALKEGGISGFSALPGETKLPDGNNRLEIASHLWTSTGNSNDEAWLLYPNNIGDEAVMQSRPIINLYAAVRCIKEGTSDETSDREVKEEIILSEHYNETTGIYEDFDMNFKMKFNKDVQIHPNKSEELYAKVVISIKDDKVYFLSAYKIYEEITDERKDILTTMYRDETLNKVGNKVDNEVKTTFLGLDATEFSGETDGMATKGISFIKDDIIFIIMLSQDNQVSESEYSDFINSFEFTSDNL